MKRLYAVAAALTILALYALFAHNSWGWCAAFIIAAAIIVGFAEHRTYITPAELEQAFEQAQHVTRTDDFDRIINQKLHEYKGMWPNGMGIE